MSSDPSPQPGNTPSEDDPASPSSGDSPAGPAEPEQEEWDDFKLGDEVERSQTRVEDYLTQDDVESIERQAAEKEEEERVSQRTFNQRFDPDSILNEKEPVTFAKSPFTIDVFNVPLQSGARIRWAALSLVVLFVLYIVNGAVTLWNQSDAEAAAGSGLGSLGSWILALIMTVVALIAGTAALGLTSVFSMSVLQETSDGKKTIASWPDAMWIDWVGESMFVLLSFFVSLLPGLMLSWLIDPTGFAKWILCPLSAILLFPPSLLSSMETSSPFVPYSADIWGSIRTQQTTWRTFYFHSGGLVFGTVAISGVLLWLIGAWSLLAIAPMLVAAQFIYFRQLGRLGWLLAQAKSASGAIEHQDEDQQNEDQHDGEQKDLA